MTRARIIVLVAAAVLVIGLGVHLAEPCEPRYAGRSLTKWLEAYQMKIWQGKFGPEGDDWTNDGPIEFAIRKIGTNGIPTMLGLLRTEDSKAKSVLLDVFDKQSLVHLSVKRDYEKHHMALLGFSLLGTNAASACHELAAFATSANESARMRALHSLKEVQPPREVYIEALSGFVHDSNPSTQQEAVEELARLESPSASTPSPTP